MLTDLAKIWCGHQLYSYKFSSRKLLSLVTDFGLGIVFRKNLSVKFWFFWNLNQFFGKTCESNFLKFCTIVDNIKERSLRKFWHLRSPLYSFYEKEMAIFYIFWGIPRLWKPIALLKLNRLSWNLVRRSGKLPILLI